MRAGLAFSTFCFLLLQFSKQVRGDSLDPEGPRFTVEPPSHVDFSNTTGVRLECAADGQPAPAIVWLLADGSRAPSVQRLRHVLANGTLVLPPFRAEEYSQDVHATVYKCRASNSVGIIVSRDVRVRAVVVQVYEAQVYDEFVIAGNTAVMKCQIPSFVADYVSVTSWLRDSSFNIHPSYDDVNGKYLILPTGELQIRDVRSTDGFSTYRCRTTHQLTRDTRLSATSGRLFVTDPHGTVPPRITESKVTVTAKQGSMVVLPCTAQAFPLPTYSWFTKAEDGRTLPIVEKDGKLMRAGGNVVLKNLEIQDSGAYVCLVQNPVGTERVEVLLGVTAPLSAFVQPPKLQVDLGQHATLQCVVGGHPVSSFTWLKDGRVLGAGAGTADSVAHDFLRINAVTKKHRGMYQCIVSNDLDSVQAAAELRLGDIPPSIVSLSPEETVHPGRKVALKCVAAGSPLPAVTWTQDDSSLPASDKFRVSALTNDEGNAVSHVNISDIRVEDGGKYACVASNKVGTKEDATRINVFGRPFIRPLGKKSVVAGNTIIIHCPYAGYPIETISWEKGGTRLPVNHLQVVFPNGTLKIQSVQRSDDAGSYTCVVRGKQGQNARRDLEVMVLVPPKINPTSFQDTRLHEGAHARIICAVVEGDLPITFTWLKDGRVISPDLGLAIRDFDEFSSVLTVSRAAPKHGGNFTCVARNAAAADSSTAQITVNVPPRWVVQPQDASAMPGLAVVIDCQASGFPAPRIEWLKAVESAPGEYEALRHTDPSIQKMANGSLVLTGAREEHEGRYLCRATNGVGNGLSKVINVDVRVPVRFDVGLRNETVHKGQDATIHCVARGDLPIHVTWLRNQERISVAPESRFKLSENSVEGGLLSQLTIPKVQRRDTSTFMCLAENTYGKDETKVQLIVIEPPDPPKDVVLVDQSSHSIKISWTRPFTGNSPVTQFVIAVKVTSDSWKGKTRNITVPGTETAATVPDLRPATAYHCRIFSVNEAGSSEPSDSISFSTLEEAPAGPPQFVTAEAAGTDIVKVSWKPPKKDLWNGSIRGYYVGYKVHDSSEPYSFLTVEASDDPSAQMLVHLEELRHFTKYSVVVQAFNHIGTSPRSDEIVVLTSEDVPGLPPENVRCNALSSQSLQVAWDPPPSSALNGVLQGYKVVYRPEDEWYEGAEVETKVTPGLGTVISGLRKFTNYSVQVLAFTRIGDGARSDSTICSTHEDVPEAPADVKAVVMSLDSVLVTWKSPQRPNGVIKRYTVYMRGVDLGKEDIVKHSLPSTDMRFEATSLKQNRRYEFWITASTALGEGQSTPVVSVTTTAGPVVPAKIVSFGGHVSAPWRTNVELLCKAVGIPPPEREWKFQGQPCSADRILPDGTLRLPEVQTADSGNYTCRVRNDYGSDDISYHVTIQVPPDAPLLSVSSATYTSLEVRWEKSKELKVPVQGYYLYYKREFGEWDEIFLGPDYDRYLINKLECGTRYQVYIAAVNRLGVGRPSDITPAKTKGSAPTFPSRHVFLKEDTSIVTLMLHTWASGGCPILYFVVQYKLLTQANWKLVSNNVLLQQREFVIPDLTAATWYSLRVTAHNNAGSTVSEYEFATRTDTGGTIAPLAARDRAVGQVPLYYDLRLVVPLSVASVAAAILGALACICCKKQRQGLRQFSEPAVAHEQEARPPIKAEYEKNSSVGSFTYLLGNSNKLNAVKNQTPTFITKDNISPYATSQINQNKEMMTFGQRTSPQVYPHIGVRDDVREGTYPRTKKQVSQQLQQCPISDAVVYTADYTTPVSEAETINLSTTINHYSSQPWLIRPTAPYDQHVPDLLDHGPESSTSNETSPDLHPRGQIRQESRRSSGNRNQLRGSLYPGLRCDPSTEETTFIFNHADPKEAGYEEEDISDSEYDKGIYKADTLRYEDSPTTRMNPSPLIHRHINSYYDDNTIAV